MPTIRDTYELPDDLDDDGWGEPPVWRRGGRRTVSPVLVLLLFILLVAGGVAWGVTTVNARERDDDFCISCHTAPESAYHRRSLDAQAGAFALDLASYHYQQIRGQGGTIRCVSCHLGDGSQRAYLDKHVMTADHVRLWLVGRNSEDLEKSGRTAGSAAVSPKVASLSNDGCVPCHQNTLLIAGTDNHIHNTLPAAYALWKAGARLIPPRGAQDAQAIIARGLTQYDTGLQCSSCHAAHRALETDRYLDPARVEAACQQCHVETRRGPVSTPTPGPATTPAPTPTPR